MRKKVLYISHNHPDVRPGGAEIYALELYEEMKASQEFQPLFLARIGPDMSAKYTPHPGTPFSAANEDENQSFCYTELSNFDSFYLTLRNKDLYYIHFSEYLLAHRPDIIHFQHTHYLGYDLIRAARNTLPDVPIVYTLHDFHPICHRDGQMVRTESEELCSKASPRRCHECFPQISSQTFFMRQHFIQAHFSLVDLFLAPSRFLLERYVEWGVPQEKIQFEDYGRRVDRRGVVPEERPRDRIGFFGQLNYYKGVKVLLEAMKVLVDDECDAHLWLHGANFELQSEEFKNEVRELLKATKDSVTMVGRYDQAQLSDLMDNIDWVVVPSIWWENSPLVIQEAFLNGRPVICSDIGGMAEKVTNSVNGLHFRAGDSQSLARTIRQAVNSPDLWTKLHEGIPDIYKIEDAAERLAGIYRELLACRASGVEANATR